MDPALLADIVVVAHLSYVGFAVVGELLILAGWAFGWAWVRQRWFRLVHLVCVVIVPIEALLGIVCPLTTWEADLRREAGQTVDELSFVARLARDLLFFEAPPWVFTVGYVAFGLVVVGTLVLIPPRWRGSPRQP